MRTFGYRSAGVHGFLLLDGALAYVFVEVIESVSLVAGVGALLGDTGP